MLRHIFILGIMTLLLYAAPPYQKVVLATFNTAAEARQALALLEEEAAATIGEGQARYGFTLLSRESGRRFIVVAEPVENVAEAKAVVELFAPFYPDAFIGRYYGDGRPQRGGMQASLPAVEAEEPPVTPLPEEQPASVVSDTLPELEGPEENIPVSDVVTVNDRQRAAPQPPELPAEVRRLEQERKITRDEVGSVLESMLPSERTELLKRWTVAPQPVQFERAFVWQNYILVLMIIGIGVLLWRYRQLQRNFETVIRLRSEQNAAPPPPAAEETRVKAPEPETFDANEAYAYGAIYEVSTALTMIREFLHEVREEALSDDALGYLDAVEERMEFLHRLSQRADQGGGAQRLWVFERYDFNLNDVLEGLSRLISHKAAEHRDEVFIMVKREVPLKLTGDGMRLQQVLLNLLDAAVDETEWGETRLNIDHIVTVGNWTTLSFAIDYGGTEHAPKLPEGHSGEDRHLESGDFMFRITRELVRMLGGELKVSEEVGSGRFYFTANFNLQSDIDRRKYRLENYHAFRRKMMVVESCATSAASLRRKLEYFKFRVEVATSWQEAAHLLERSGEEYGELFINDVTLEAGGTEAVIKALEAFEGEVAVITYHVGKYDAQFSRTVHYLEKPYTMQRVFLLLQEFEGDRDLPEEVSAEPAQFEPEAEPESEPEQIISLPRPEEAYGGEEIYPFETHMPPPQLKGRHVLLVDANRTNQAILKWIFSEEGVETTVVADIDGALEQLNGGVDLDLMLLDLQSLESEEERLIDAVRGDVRWQKLPIIALTTEHPEDVVSWIREKRVDGYLSKPVYKEDLFDLFKEILYQRSQAS